MDEIEKVENPPEVKEAIQSLEEFVGNETNKQNILALAEQIEGIIGKNWVTVDRLMSKGKGETEESIMIKLRALKLFNLVQVRTGDTDDTRKNFRKTLFKITISDKDRIEALDRIIWYHQGEIAKLTLQKNSLIDKNSTIKN